MAGKRDEGHDDELYIIGGAALLVVGIFFFFGQYIIAAILWEKSLWIKLADLVYDGKTINAIQVTFSAYAPTEWTWGKVSALSKFTRFWAFPLLGTTLAFWAIYNLRKIPTRGFKKTHSMDTLAKSQLPAWPWLAPVINKDILNAPLDKGPYAMGMTELEFCNRYKLFENVNSLNINEAKTQKLFSSQMGRLWDGEGALEWHERALYACFIAQICGGREATLDALADLTKKMAHNIEDTKKTDILLDKYKDDPRVKKIVGGHAYVTTVLSATLEAARLEYGKIPPLMFIWLRTYDRPLWYLLQSIGRNTPFTEAAGVYSHYSAELVAGRAIELPFVKNAVTGLKWELSKVKVKGKESAG